MTTLEQDIAWCRWLFKSLADRGMWGVPRSGLNFQRQGDKLVLIAKMPWMVEMEGTLTDKELEEQQNADYLLIKNRFEAAGITVETIL